MYCHQPMCPSVLIEDCEKGITQELAKGSVGASFALSVSEGSSEMR